MLDCSADPLVECCYFTSPSIDLRPAGNARLYAVANRIYVSGICHQYVRSRTYQRHVPPEYINELRQFVQARHAEERAHSRDSRISGPGEYTSERISMFNVH